MMDCPERRFQACAYTLQQSRLSSVAGWIILVISAVFVVADLGGAIMLVVVVPSKGAILGGLFALSFFMLIPISMLAIGVYMTFGEQVTLFNPETGRMWQRRSLWGREVRRVVVTDVEALPLDMYLRWSLTYPTSLSALTVKAPPSVGIALPGGSTILKTMIASIGGNPASYLFEAALLGLVQQSQVGIRKARLERSSFGRPPRQADEYLVVAGEAINERSLDGVLERDIVNIVKGWTKRAEARQWPQGAPIYELVRGIYPADQSSPGDWLVHRVQDDAVKRGLGTVHGRLRRSFELGASAIVQLDDEARQVSTIYTQLARVYPDFIRYLDSKVRQGIASRQESSG
jgi:hypothetical protein